MKTISICGKRGLGDIIASISYILTKIQEDSHLIFYLPRNFDYVNTINFLMNEFEYPSDIKITHEVCEDWSTVDHNIAEKKFGVENLNNTWFFMNQCGYGEYLPFKTKWKKNSSGPIALIVNNERNDSNYPYPDKFFNARLNDILSNMIDEKNYVYLGKPFTIKESIEKFSNCRYAVGIDTSWAHVANCMRIPYFLVRNNLDIQILNRVHKRHPTLKIIEECQTFDYLVL